MKGYSGWVTEVELARGNPRIGESLPRKDLQAAAPMDYAKNALIRELRRVQSELESESRELHEHRYSVQATEKRISYLNATFDEVQTVLAGLG